MTIRVNPQIESQRSILFLSQLIHEHSDIASRDHSFLSQTMILNLQIMTDDDAISVQFKINKDLSTNWLEKSSTSNNEGALEKTVETRLHTHVTQTFTDKIGGKKNPESLDMNLRNPLQKSACPCEACAHTRITDWREILSGKCRTSDKASSCLSSNMVSESLCILIFWLSE